LQRCKTSPITKRCDITYAVQTVSRFTKNPGTPHWEAVKKIFHYLKGTKDLWLSYGGQQKDLVGYADADGNMAEDRHTISGYAFILHGGAVSWSTKRQEIISLSTTESEYIAATYASKEKPCGFAHSSHNSSTPPVPQQSYFRTINRLSRLPRTISTTPELSIRLIYCPTEEMVADTLTKALPSPKVKHFARELGLVMI
jgi:hypothetical protein